LHIEFLVEEPSAKEVLDVLLPQLLAHHSFDVHPFRGKSHMLRDLPGRLQGYKSWPDEYRHIVILIDRDDDNCHDLKARLENIARDAGYTTKSSSGAHRPYEVLNRIAIEELEAWFFGDVEALHLAYGLSPHLGERAPYRNPDNIAGGTWEALERELQHIGQFKTGLRKIEAARTIAAQMDPARNRSKSFQVFCNGLLDLISE
jgi:Domain of unknown function (DUF4276)